MALTRQQMQDNIRQQQAYLDAHPVDPNNADAVQARALVEAALAAAQAQLDGGDLSVAGQTFDQAQRVYHSYATTAGGAEMAAATSGGFLGSLEGTLKSAAGLAGILVVAFLLVGGRRAERAMGR